MKEIIASFSRLRVLVYGDFVLDEFLYGQIDRISREAPVFIVSHERSDFRPGCAANAVANLAALGATVLPCGTVGDDEYGYELRRILAEHGVNTEGIIGRHKARTPLKTRVIAGGLHSIKQQIVRIDRLNGMGGGETDNSEIRICLAERLDQCDAVLISDYGIGSLTIDTARWLLGEARQKDLPVLVDSRYRLGEYAGATAMTPNHPEAEALVGRLLNDSESLHSAGLELLEQLKVEALVITRGPDGMTLFEPGADPFDIPAHGDEEVVDVTGAGDTVIATFTLGVASGAGYRAAAQLANIAGGLSVSKKGTAVVNTGELADAIDEGGE